MFVWHDGKVNPCDYDYKSVLSKWNVKESSIKEIWNSENYNSFRKKHIEGKFDDISYCKNCDFLYQDSEILVWSNDTTAKINHMLGTDDDFILTKYNKTNM